MKFEYFDKDGAIEAARGYIETMNLQEENSNDAFPSSSNIVQSIVIKPFGGQDKSISSHNLMSYKTVGADVTEAIFMLIDFIQIGVKAKLTTVILGSCVSNNFMTTFSEYFV